MAFPKAPRSWKSAINTAVSYWKTGRYVTAGYCLREVRQYYGVPSKYPAAKDSMNAAIRAGRAWRIHDWSQVPRGAIVYWYGGGSQYGHIAISLGKGYVISTDWPRNRYGRVHGATLMASWGYTVAYWSDTVNDYDAFDKKSQKPKPKWPKKYGKRVNRARVNRALKNLGKYDGKTVTGQLWVVAHHLRKETKYSVDGWPPHQASVKRALENFQEAQGWRGAGADGLLGKQTAKRLGIKSHWAPLPEWRNRRRKNKNR